MLWHYKGTLDYQHQPWPRHDIDHVKQNGYYVTVIKHTVLDSGLCEQYLQSPGLTASEVGFLFACTLVYYDKKPSRNGLNSLISLGCNDVTIDDNFVKTTILMFNWLLVPLQ